MLTLAPYQLIQLHWPLPLEQQPVQPELGKSKFHKLHAAIQQGKIAPWQWVANTDAHDFVSTVLIMSGVGLWRFFSMTSLPLDVLDILVA